MYSTAQMLISEKEVDNLQFDRQSAIEEIIKGVFELDELQAIHVAGAIYGMATANRLLETSSKAISNQKLLKLQK